MPLMHFDEFLDGLLAHTTPKDKEVGGHVSKSPAHLQIRLFKFKRPCVSGVGVLLVKKICCGRKSYGEGLGRRKEDGSQEW